MCRIQSNIIISEVYNVLIRTKRMMKTYWWWHRGANSYKGRCHSASARTLVFLQLELVFLLSW